MVRTILIWPDPVLKQKAKPVARVDDAVRTLIQDMFETMYAAEGVGLARLGYTQIITKTSGSITAYGYKKGDSLVSLSGGNIGGLSLTAIIFASAAGPPAES